MARICWCTDIHLDHLWEHVLTPNGMFDGTRRYSRAKVKEFCDEINIRNPDCVVITGDISIATMIETHLEWLEEFIPRIPIYFVLGNHDYYDGSIADVRSRLQGYNGTTGRLIWLTSAGVVPLTEKNRFDWT